MQNCSLEVGCFLCVEDQNEVFLDWNVKSSRILFYFILNIQFIIYFVDPYWNLISFSFCIIGSF